MISENKRLVGSVTAGILIAFAILESIAHAPFTSITASPKPKFMKAIVGFVNLSTSNLTIIEKHGGKVLDTYLLHAIAAVLAEIPRENITKLAEEETIEYIEYAGHTMLYGDKEPLWNVTIESTFEQLKLTMYLEKTVFQLGEDAKVKFTLTNIGEQNVTLIAGSGKTFDFVVYNSTHSEIHRWSSHLFFTMAVKRITLKPGDNIGSVPYKWEQIYDISNPSIKYDFLPVPPGSYYIVGETLFSYGVAQLQTSPVEIIILQT